MIELSPILAPADTLQKFKKNPERLLSTSPQAYEKLTRLFALYQRVKNQPPEIAQQIIATHFKGVVGNLIPLDNVYHELLAAIKSAKAFVASLVHEFIPGSLRFVFTSDGVATPTGDPLEILKIIWNPPGCRHFQLLRSFDSLLYWHLGIRYMLMRLLYKPLESQLRDLTIWLENELFINGICTEVIRSSRDPANENRHTTEQTRYFLEQPISCRFIKIGKRPIKVLYDCRDKRLPDLFRKVLLQSKAEQPFVSDHCAFTLVFFSEEDYHAVLEKLRREIFCEGNAITNLRINGNGARKKPFSSYLSPPQMQFRALIHGGLVEVQLFLYPEYFNRQFSTGKENHNFYRLSQVLSLFRLFFPAIYYGINWDNPKILQQLHKFQLFRIRANYPEG